MRRVSRLLPTALLVLAQLIGPGGRAEEVAGTGQRCGVDWDEANGKCGTQCPHDSSEECPAGGGLFQRTGRRRRLRPRAAAAAAIQRQPCLLVRRVHSRTML